MGYRTGQETDRGRTAWDCRAARPLAWAAWYPADPDDPSGPPPTGQAFDLGEVAPNARLAAGPSFPVVLLSHGTGGTPESLGWLAARLAQRGYVVIGACHHGNSGREPYRAEGFLCWWERPLDLSALLSILARTGPFADRLDLARVDAIGFSLGGYAVLSLAGARTSMDRFLAWSEQQGEPLKGPREFPDVADSVQRLQDSSPVFRSSWARQGQDFRDDRIRSVIAIAPAPAVRGFDPASLASIRIPVTLITGEADREAPSRDCAAWVAATNPTFEWTSAGETVGHYTFLGRPRGKVTEDTAFLFTDNPGVDRAAVHDAVFGTVLEALRKS